MRLENSSVLLLALLTAAASAVRERLCVDLSNVPSLPFKYRLREPIDKKVVVWTSQLLR